MRKEREHVARAHQQLKREREREREREKIFVYIARILLTQLTSGHSPSDKLPKYCTIHFVSLSLLY